MTNKQEKVICNSFGIAKLKAFQKDVITDLLNGKDVLGLARTSEGKSICFLSMIAMHPNDLMIGILPTVALMRDLALRGQQDPSGLPVQRQCREYQYY